MRKIMAAFLPLLFILVITPGSPAAAAAAPAGTADIVSIQQRLIELGYLSGPPSGTFDADTRAAIAALEDDNGLSKSEGLSDLLKQNLRNAEHSATFDRGECRTQGPLVICPDSHGNWTVRSDVGADGLREYAPSPQQQAAAAERQQARSEEQEQMTGIFERFLGELDPAQSSGAATAQDTSARPDPEHIAKDPNAPLVWLEYPDSGLGRNQEQYSVIYRVYTGEFGSGSEDGNYGLEFTDSLVYDYVIATDEFCGANTPNGVSPFHVERTRVRKQGHDPAEVSESTFVIQVDKAMYPEFSAVFGTMANAPKAPLGFVLGPREIEKALRGWGCNSSTVHQFQENLLRLRADRISLQTEYRRNRAKPASDPGEPYDDAIFENGWYLYTDLPAGVVPPIPDTGSMPETPFSVRIERKGNENYLLRSYTVSQLYPGHRAFDSHLRLNGTVRRTFLEDAMLARNEGAFILDCRYQQPNGLERTFSYWLRSVPPSASPARLRSRIANHPLLELDAHIGGCPAQQPN